MDILKSLLGDALTRSRSKQRPLVTLSYAQSLDGCISTAKDERLGLSGPETKLLTHQLRSAHDAILVGIGTVLTDDPRLTARLAGGPHPQPVVLDGLLRLPLESALMHREDCKPWVFCGERAPEEREKALCASGVRVFRIGSGVDEGLDLREMLGLLGQAGVVSLMVEGGGRVITSFLANGLADQAVLTVVPFWVGGYASIGAAVGAGGLRPVIVNPQVEAFGRDFVVWGRIGEERYETQGAVFRRT